MAQQVGTVRGNLQLEDGIRLHKGAHGGAHHVVLRQNPQAVFLVRQAQLRSRAKHATALHAAQLAILNLPAAGQHSTGQSAGNLVAHLVVLGAAHNLAQGALAGIDHAHIEVVAALHGGFLHDLGHHHEFGGHAALLDTLHLDTGEGEHIGHLLSAEALEVNVAGKPIQ